MASCPRPLVQIDENFTDNLFILAVHAAFDKHYPLHLSPDVIWNLIVQGVCRHMMQPDIAEKYRNKFVTFQGTKPLVVVRDQFIMDGPNNDWSQVVAELGQQIAK